MFVKPRLSGRAPSLAGARSSSTCEQAKEEVPEQAKAEGAEMSEASKPGVEAEMSEV